MYCKGTTMRRGGRCRVGKPVYPPDWCVARSKKPAGGQMCTHQLRYRHVIEALPYLLARARARYKCLLRPGHLSHPPLSTLFGLSFSHHKLPFQLVGLD